MQEARRCQASARAEGEKGVRKGSESPESRGCGSAGAARDTYRRVYASGTTYGRPSLPRRIGVSTGGRGRG